MYEGACVADKMVDLLVCLKQSGATGALSRAEAVVRERPPNGTDQADSRVSREVSMKLAELSADERRLILQLCKEAADQAGVKVLAPRPEPTPTLTTKSTPPIPRNPQPAPAPAAPCNKAGELCASSKDCCIGLICRAPAGGTAVGQGAAPTPVCSPK